MELSKGLKLFLAQFINTLVVTLIVSSNAEHTRAYADASPTRTPCLTRQRPSLPAPLHQVYASVPRLSRIPLLFSGPFQDFLPG